MSEPPSCVDLQFLGPAAVTFGSVEAVGASMFTILVEFTKRFHHGGDSGVGPHHVSWSELHSTAVPRNVQHMQNQRRGIAYRLY